MAIAPIGPDTSVERAGASAQPWPSERAGFYILFCVIFATFLLMVVGMSLVFYFVTTPLERVIIWVFSIVSRRATFFTSRYALRSKGRNSLISLMVVASAVLPCLLATQLALQDANLDTDFRFMRGSPAEARYQSMGGIQFFGLVGIVAGPLVVAISFALLDSYRAQRSGVVLRSIES